MVSFDPKYVNGQSCQNFSSLRKLLTRLTVVLFLGLVTPLCDSRERKVHALRQTCLHPLPAGDLLILALLGHCCAVRFGIRDDSKRVPQSGPNRVRSKHASSDFGKNRSIKWTPANRERVFANGYAILDMEHPATPSPASAVGCRAKSAGLWRTHYV